MDWWANASYGSSASKFWSLYEVKTRCTFHIWRRKSSLRDTGFDLLCLQLKYSINALLFLITHADSECTVLLSTAFPSPMWKVLVCLQGGGGGCRRRGILTYDTVRLKSIKWEAPKCYSATQSVQLNKQKWKGRWLEEAGPISNRLVLERSTDNRQIFPFPVIYSLDLLTYTMP